MVRYTSTTTTSNIMLSTFQWSHFSIFVEVQAAAITQQVLFRSSMMPTG